jgi:HAMP domain-containing protein
VLNSLAFSCVFPALVAGCSGGFVLKLFSVSGPRQVIKPLLSLKEAVDHAALGNYGIEFEVHGKGEIVDLAESLRRACFGPAAGLALKLGTAPSSYVAMSSRKHI